MPAPAPPVVRLTACPVCASPDIRMPTVGDGVGLGGGEMQFMVCQECHYRGPPIELADAEAFAKLREALRPPANAGQAEGTGTPPPQGAEMAQRYDAGDVGETEPWPGADDPGATRSPVSGAIIIALGALLAPGGGLVLALALFALVSGELLLSGLILGGLGLGIGLALVRIGLRMWKG